MLSYCALAHLAAGSALLVSAQTEVDTTGQSYYGETNLYYMSVKDATSIVVQLGV